MSIYWLRFELMADATFGKGEGLAGVVDQEVDHDADGLPFLRGRALKGLLNEECANILHALASNPTSERWAETAQRLWGSPGSTIDDDARLRVGDARLPADLRKAVRQAVCAKDSALHAIDILESLTTIRRQTAVSAESGAPDPHTLRAMRVVLRKTVFEAPLTFIDQAPLTFIDQIQTDDLPLLAACVLGLRRAGTGRNRGRGRLRATLHIDRDGRPADDITHDLFKRFAQEVG